MSSSTPSGSSGPSQSDSSPDPPLSWEGDRMFNIYIHDYCTKRGFVKTAQELKIEAALTDINHETPSPPINAKQGLLFEWWSVFWQLFSAKSSGQGSEDAVLYTQHQAIQSAKRDRGVIGGPPQPRLPNGAPAPRPAVALVPNNVAGNGPAPAGHGHQPGPFPGSNNQLNGMTNGTTATAPSPAQSGTFTPMVPNPRPMGSQQRGPNGMGPFQSPTMAHSPQNPGQPHPSGQMNQMGTPQMGHMNRGGMPPPNGTQPGMPNSAHQTPQPPFRSPSRPSTPGQNSITHASPSMAARQTPNLAQHELINNEFRQVPMQALPQLKQEIGLGDKDLQAFTVQDKHNIIQAWRRRVQKPPQGQPNAVAGPSGTPMMAPGNPRLQPNQQQGQPQGMAPGQQRPIKRNSTSPAEEQDSLLRTDSSPPDRKRPRRSPNAEHQQQQQGQQQQQSQQPAMAPFPHAHPQGGGPGGPGGPQHMPNVLMRPPQMGGPPMGNFPGQPGMPNMINNPGMNMGMGQMGPGGMNAMSPGMMNHPQGGMVNPGPHSQQQYRQTMHNLHKSNLPPGALNMMPGQNMNSPHSNDPLFNNADGGQGQRQPFPGGVPNNRMQGPKAGQMPPPPSPAMNGIGKGPQGGPKPEGVSEQGAQNGRPEGSPQNASAGIGQGQNQQQGNPGQPSTAPPTPASNGMTAPSPSQILSSSAPGMNPSSGNSTDSMPSNLFTTDFMSSMGSMNGGAFDDIDPAIFGGLRDTDINFERDFGQWFNPDDVALDMTK